MSPEDDLITLKPSFVLASESPLTPAVIRRAGPSGTKRFADFFTANIRNSLENPKAGRASQASRKNGRAGHHNDGVVSGATCELSGFVELPEVRNARMARKPECRNARILAGWAFWRQQTAVLSSP
jgi:hypothetical protein